MSQAKARLIAFYLPQFHPIPENDEWWGKGFTEWTNVAKAKPLFPGHYQPHTPADLGFYDLRVPETRQAQADLARKAGIEGFCYWHYWFAGKRLLERPFNEVLSSGQPDFPFCLGWANQSWSGIWHGSPKKILIQQTYPGAEDHERHFYANLPAFQDPRYVRVDGKPLFLVHSPEELPETEAFIEQWQQLAQKNGLPGIHFVANLFHGRPECDPEKLGYDAVTVCNPSRIRWGSKYEVALARLNKASNNGTKLAGLGTKFLAMADAYRRKFLGKYHRLRGYPTYVFEYADAMLFFQENDLAFKTVYPSIIPNWDNSPRSSGRATILTNSTPELFRRHLKDALRQAAGLPADRRIVFVKSWNEWAEGNYLEPDLKFGHQYLDVVREEALGGSVQSDPRAI
jgi:lipopolysaccharide biosynthesis protein